MSFPELFKNKDKCTEFALLFKELIKPFKIIKNDDNYILVESVKDLGGNDRVVVCRFLQK